MIEFTNSYQLHINHIYWECGDGCCSDSYNQYELWDPINKKTRASDDECRMDEDEIVEMIIEDFELCIKS